jgi:hypothetical protein
LGGGYGKGRRKKVKMYEKNQERGKKNEEWGKKKKKWEVNG